MYMLACLAASNAEGHNSILCNTTTASTVFSALRVVERSLKVPLLFALSSVPLLVVPLQ